MLKVQPTKMCKKAFSAELFLADQQVFHLIWQGFDDLLLSDTSQFVGFLQGLFDDGLILSIAQYNTYRWVFVWHPYRIIEQGQVKIYFARTFRKKFACVLLHGHQTF